MLDNFIKRGMRQLKSIKLTNLLQSYRERKLEKLDISEIRKKVQSLYHYEEGAEEWGVGSKFQMDAFVSSDNPKTAGTDSFPTDLKLDTIVKFIEESSAHENLKVYQSKEKDLERVTNIILSLSNTSARRALLQSILSGFKPLFPKRQITVDGNNGNKSDWIVIDLRSVIVHIFDPQTRQVVDLDSKLRSEMDAVIDDSFPTFASAFSTSIPRSIASRPRFIEKYIKSKQ